MALARHSIQLLVIDAQLPDVQGEQLVRNLRREGVSLPVIFLAAGWLDHGSYKTLTGELGVRRVMHKPFSAYQFVMEVEGTLSRAARPPTIPPTTDEPATKPRRMRSDPSFPAVDGPSPYGAAVSLLVVGKDEALEVALREAAAAAIVSVTTVADGVEAARSAAREHFDGALFLVDPADPDLAFAEATELLCSDEGKGLPAGFVCSEDQVALQVDAIHAGGVAFLSAPIKPRHVRQAAASMAQLRRGRQPAVVIVADDVQVAELTGELEPGLPCRAGLAVAISSHDRKMARALVDELELDVLMCRYNAAHRGAETDIFESLPERRAGIVSYTATRWGRLLKPAGDLGPMTAGECYRFVLANPAVDVALCSPRSWDELREDVAAVAAGPLDADCLAEVRAFGDRVHASPGGWIGFAGG